MNESKPTRREIHSNIEAYSLAPWGEDQSYSDTEIYFSKLHSHPDSFFMEFRDSPDNPPYLYVHGLNYKSNAEAMIENEFVGKHAYWRALDGSAIVNALQDYKHVSYINNIHADKSVKISSDKKPRLKVLPEILQSLFSQNGSDTIVLFTHRTTGLYRAVNELDKKLYNVQSIKYKAECVMTKFNSHHKIDHLSLLVITKHR